MPILAYLLSVGSILVSGLFLLSYALGPPVDRPAFARRSVASTPQYTAPKPRSLVEAGRSTASSSEDPVEFGTTALPEARADAGLVIVPIVQSDTQIGESVPLPKPNPLIRERMPANKSLVAEVGLKLNRSKLNTHEMFEAKRGQRAELRRPKNAPEADPRNRSSPFAAFAFGPKHGW
jgi:hypothetical protein